MGTLRYYTEQPNALPRLYRRGSPSSLVPNEGSSQVSLCLSLCLSVSFSISVSLFHFLYVSLSLTYEAPSTFQQATAKIRDWVHEKWLKAWDESNKARRVWQHMRRPDRASPWWKLPRAEQSIIAQCRTGHCPVGAYFARLRQIYNDRCRHCSESEENIDHILRECPQLRQLRGRLSV